MTTPRRKPEQWLGTSAQYKRLQRRGVLVPGSLNAADGSVGVATAAGPVVCRLNEFIVAEATGYSVAPA
ncbi:hypothetical protein F0P96_10515 [Hymenobacter busanensis]|uniref:Uncharacterized protein n=1 Tax=Hymenobacter busanensis TaxID=2607656 RepID=A0A7L4ZY15_9BACT|nr:hypothetical protein [Hymenobacter busanensis]KAA9333393.1 hypothetical protein F0P96_10515 [Hymenobacter busanensis]QHJ07927.1 hypothetical protein GUY19_11790 [Hymenobacter busanensis]